MATSLTQTTELQAVNQMLGTISEAPINTLAGVTSLDAQNSIAVLAEVSRAVQTAGYHFNTEVALPLQPDASTGEIPLPLNCIDVDTTGYDESVDVVQRGLRLYDRKNHTFVFNRQLLVDMTVLLPFDELPEAARRYIAIRACRLFQKRYVGDSSLEAFTQDEENTAMRMFKSVIGKNADHNIFNSPDMQRMLRR